MSLAHATRAEITKQFTTAGWWVIGIILAVYLVFNVGVIGAAFGWQASQNDTASLGSDLTATMYSMAGSSGYIFALLFGTLMVTTEFRHKLIVPTFLATPRRGSALVAKMFAGVVMGLLYGVIAVIITVATTVGTLAGFGIETDIGAENTWLVLARALLAVVLWSLIGIGVGSVIRNQVAAIIVVLAFTVFIEPILRTVAAIVDWLPAVTKWMPGSATDALIGYNVMAIGGLDTDMLSWWAGALVLVGYAVIFSVIGAVTTWRRDVA